MISALRKNGIILAAVWMITLQACKKDKSAPAPVDNGSTTVVPVTDPAVAVTQGFFLDDWQPKTFTITNYTDVPKSDQAADAAVTTDMGDIITKISPYLLGNNINPYMTQVITEPVLMNNLKSLSPKIIRAPGGSLSDVYFWNAADQQAPADVPQKLLDAQGDASAALPYWYGKNTAAWTLSIDNYYNVLQSTASTGIITINYGYARYGTSEHPDQTAAHLAANWVRYDKGKTKFWEIGNESYGNWEAGYRIDPKFNKDGQPEILTGTLYGRHFKVFVDSMRKAAAEVGATIKIGAVMKTSDGSGGGVEIPNWNADVLAQIGTAADFYIIHDYYTPYAQNSTIATILNTPDAETANVMNYIKNATSSSPKPIAMTEWNIQATGSSQMVSNIAGLHALMTFCELIKNKLGEASRWDLANGWNNGDDMGLFNIGDEPGADKWNPRPAFYYQYFFRQFFGDRMFGASVTGSSDVMAYASAFSSGQAGLVLVNKGASSHITSVSFKNFAPGNRYYYYVLNGEAGVNFSRKVYVNGIGPSGASGGPDTYTSILPVSSTASGGIKVNIPAYGAVYLVVDSK